MTTSPIRARLYDGRTSGALDATLAIAASGHFASLTIHTAGTDTSVPFTAVHVGERVGETHRIVQLPDGGSLEVIDDAAFDAALKAAGLRTAEAPIRRLESRWRYALLAVVTTLLASAGFLKFGAPALAARAVRFIPPRVDSFIATDTLRVLDSSTFRPTTLTTARQAQLRGIFSDITVGVSGSDAHFRLEFRGGGSIGANALALPSGIVVLTDELEQLARNDDELRGVLAHEVGHLVNRHAMRMLVQASATTLLIVGVFGDVSGVSSLAAVAPTVLVTAAYSRDFEREADAFAARWMGQHQVDPRRLAALLERLAERQGGDQGGFLASHPGLQERLQALGGSP